MFELLLHVCFFDVEDAFTSTVEPPRKPKCVLIKQHGWGGLTSDTKFNERVIRKTGATSGFFLLSSSLLPLLLLFEL